jgi:hypothetical protein
MKIKVPHPSPAMVVAIVALFVALGGTALAFTLGRNSVHSKNIAPGAVRAKDLGKLTLHFGKIIDKDTTAFDGSFFYAIGHAVCDKGERVISGGLRQIAGNAGLVGQHIWMVESGPFPSKREWLVKMSSDLGGAARDDFVAVVSCLAK